MKINILIIALILGLFFSVSNSKMPQYEEMAMNQIINDIYKDKTANSYTCESVVLYSEGKITQKQCENKLEKTNEHCASLAKSSMLALNTQEHAKNLVQILVTCPVAKMLGKEYKIENGKAIMPKVN